jgi:hypothetical protein
MSSFSSSIKQYELFMLEFLKTKSLSHELSVDPLPAIHRLDLVDLSKTDS